MSPSHGVPKRALIAGLLALMISAVPASAQLVYSDARQLLDFSPDPLARSPRHIGMGALKLVGPDPHMRITLWDFAQNPTGLGDADSLSTVELRPFTSSISSERDVVGSAPLQRRQSLAARETRFGYEAWSRPADGSGTTFGAVGSFSRLRFDRPITEDIERRNELSVPDATLIFNGPMPRLMEDRMRYAVRLVWSDQDINTTYRSVFRNASGEFVDKDGGLLNTPDFFTPDESRVKTMGLGVAASMTWGDPLTVALGYDRLSSEFLSKNQGTRHESEVREDRPLNKAQLSLIGKVGENFNWGADAQAWVGKSDQQWVFTVSAGPGNPPLVGRGSLLEREEDGRSARARARWFVGPFEVGGAVSYAESNVENIAPPPGALGSFNYFRNFIFNQFGADTLTLPDSIVANKFEERAIGAGGGIAWNMNDRTILGAEYHWLSDKFETRLNGEGPERWLWEVRSGLEYVLTPVVTLRGGYIYRSEDQDELTEQNEFLSNAITLGLGFQPAGARWHVDAGYIFQWGQADFGDPTKPRGDRQQLGTQIRWVF